MAFDVEPGSYQLVVSRGTEYSVHSAPLTITAGATTNVTPQIARVLDTPGFVSSDFHVHGIRSADSRVADGPRVAQFAGEGVENIIMTDHHVHTDLLPTIAALGLGGFVTSTVGEEITTFDYGHFNGYPFTIDPSVPSGGSTDWGQAAPAGQDFPSSGDPGALNATPAVIHALATAGARSRRPTPPSRSTTSTRTSRRCRSTPRVAGPIIDDLDDAGRAGRRLPSAAAVANLFLHFPALELWNGADRAQQDEFLGAHRDLVQPPEQGAAHHGDLRHGHAHLRRPRVGRRAHLDRGLDRRWWPRIDGGEVARAVDAGRAVGGQGIYVQTRLLAASTGQAADLTLAGSTDLTTTDGAVNLEIRVQAPLWAQFDRIEVYANGLPAPDAEGSTSPYLYTAAPPAVTLRRGRLRSGHATGGRRHSTSPPWTCTRPCAGGKRQEVTLTVPFTRPHAGHLVRGRGEGHGRRLRADVPGLPAQPRTPAATTARPRACSTATSSERGTMALGVANALYADVDGVPGSSRRIPERSRLRGASRGAGAARRRGRAAPSRAAAAPRAGRRGHGADRSARSGAARRGGHDRGPQRARCARLARDASRSSRRWRAGAARGDAVVIAWEELASSRPPRFANGDRVLLALEPLAAGSLWRKRFGDPKALLAARGVAQRGAAFLRSPSPRQRLAPPALPAAASRPSQRARGAAPPDLARRRSAAPARPLGRAPPRRARRAGRRSAPRRRGWCCGRSRAAESDAELATSLLIWIERRQPNGLEPALDAALAGSDRRTRDLRDARAALLGEGLPGERERALLASPSARHARRSGERRRPGAATASRRSAAPAIPLPRCASRRSGASRASRAPPRSTRCSTPSTTPTPAVRNEAAHARGRLRPRGRAAAARGGRAGRGRPPRAPWSRSAARTTTQRARCSSKLAEEHPDERVRTLAALALGRAIGHKD